MQPANGFKFWSAVESAMERNIDDLSAAEIVDLLLSFAYLGHYPEAESQIAKTVLFDGGKHLQHTEVKMLKMNQMVTPLQILSSGCWVGRRSWRSFKS